MQVAVGMVGLVGMVDIVAALPAVVRGRFVMVAQFAFALL